MSNYPPPPPPPPPSGGGDPSVPPGMYRASNGNVYPQQPQQGYQPQLQPPPPQKKGKGGKVALIVIGAIVALCALGGILVAIAGTSGEDDATNSSGTTVAGAPATTAKAGEASLYPDRPDKKKGDKERAVGQSADLSGYTVTLKSAAFRREISQFEKDGYLVTAVSIVNRDQKAQSFNPFDWKLITPQGTIIDPCLCTGTPDRLNSGDLVTGGKVDGSITFEVGTAKGNYYLIFDPSGFDNERAVWQVTI